MSGESPRSAAAISRRRFLHTSAMGIGSLALSTLLARPAAAAERSTHHAPTAKRVIWLYMDGGMSHLDTFDPKPRLTQDHSKPFPLKMEATQFDSNGPVLKSPWQFKQHGQSGMAISALFPHLAKHADRLAVIRSMTNESAVHANANYWMNTGWGMMGRPSVGAWVNYGLGSEADNLPGYVVLNGGLIPTGGIDNFKSGFLPASHGPTLFERSDPAVPNLTAGDAARQPAQLGLIDALDRGFSASLGHPDAVESAMRNYELAAKLQVSVPDLLAIDGESKATRELYGLDHQFEHTRTYARQCLLARRLVERGVRFVALSMPRVQGDGRWDAHGGLTKNHEEHARTVDQPVAALLADLAGRGLLADTLVAFVTEFGRTPFSQGGDGRDHNQYGFSVWLAGGGVKGGTVYGATDEYGYKVVDGKMQIHDLHATLLHLLGVDHTKQTYRFSGRDFRLTDVHGRVVRELLA